MADTVTQEREALRRKLRDKIRGKRGSTGPQLARRMKDDPTTTMLSLGVDDPSLLEHAKMIVRNPEAALRVLTTELASCARRTHPLVPNTRDDEEAPPPASDDEEAPPPASDDEEAPPPAHDDEEASDDEEAPPQR